jgi:hypothetical protein
MSDVTVEHQASIARRYGNRAVALSLGSNWEELEIPPAVFESAAENKNHQVLEFLIDVKGPIIVITCAVVAAAARVRNLRAMEVVMRHRAVEVSEAMVKALTDPRINKPLWGTCNEYEERRKILLLLLNQESKRVRMTERMLVHIVSELDEEMVCRFFDRSENKICITEEILKAAANNWGVGEGIMSFLLDQEEGSTNIRITEAVLEAAASNYESNMMQLLLDRKAHEMDIPEAVVMAATKRWHEGRRGRWRTLRTY